MKIRLSRLIGLALLLSLSLLMTACGKPDSPKAVSKQFWEAVQERDMETAKLYATWDTVDYLKYLKGEKLHPERFELGEQMLGETRSEVATVLFTSKMGKTGVKIPGITVLLKTKYGWRVNVKKTMTSVVKYTANNVFDQLNGLMQEGIKELDSSLSNSMNELGRALEEGAEELKRELSRPLYTPKTQNLDNHSGQQI
ncbi:MAG: hypothetical protein V3U71_04065 [Cocleimonas sp.]